MALAGVRVIEFAGLAPGPFAGMVLADFGADVIRIDRAEAKSSSDILVRGKKSLAVSLKSPAGITLVLALIAKADVVIDPFRPGVLERLGLGPEAIAKASKGRAVLARLTGYRRTGKWSKMAGHDINYLALSGVLSMIRGPRSNLPVPPVNILGDFAGGGLMCVCGILLALLEREKSGRGQVVEADMVTGTRYLSSFLLLATAPGSGSFGFSAPPGTNLLDGGAPFYGVYECKDGGFMSLGALEPQFYKAFIDILVFNAPPLQSEFSVSDPLSPQEAQVDPATWPALRAYFTRAFLSKTRDEWTTIFGQTDSCVAPVLTVDEVDAASETGITSTSSSKDVKTYIPAPAPHLSRTPAKRVEQEYVKAAESGRGFSLQPGKHSREVLAKDLGLGEGEVQRLVSDGVVRDAGKGSKL